MRLVFDSNVLISALLFEHSTPGQAFYGGIRRSQVLVSDATYAEISQTLDQPRFDRYVSSDDRNRFLVMLLHVAALVEIQEPIQACRDSKDDKFLEVAVSGGASHIVTGDQDLLVLNPYRGISIVTPAEFLKYLAEPSDP